MSNVENELLSNFKAFGDLILHLLKKGDKVEGTSVHVVDASTIYERSYHPPADEPNNCRQVFYIPNFQGDDPKITLERGLLDWLFQTAHRIDWRFSLRNLNLAPATFLWLRLRLVSGN